MTDDVFGGVKGAKATHPNSSSSDFKDREP